MELLNPQQARLRAELRDALADLGRELEVVGAASDDRGLLERRLPAAILRDLAVVDTPGTNAIVRQHEALTREFVPRADLVLFVTSADRPFTESERELLAAIGEWGK